MNAISYPLVNGTVSKIFQHNDNEITDNKIIKFKINKTPLVVEKEKGINQVFDNLCQKEWIESADNFENTDLHKLLNTLIEQPLPEVMLGFREAMRVSLPIDHATTFRFENNAQSGVSVHYSVVHNDAGCNLFQLNCEFPFDKDCSLTNEKPNVSVEYFPQCPEDLKQALDPRAMMRKILDWIKNLLGGNSHHVLPTANTDKAIVLSVSDKLRDMNEILQSPIINYYKLSVESESETHLTEGTPEEKEHFLSKINYGLIEESEMEWDSYSS